MGAINQQLVDQVVAICQRAGDAIMAVYRTVEGIDVNYKADDSPLTQADLAAHKLLAAELPLLLTDIPLLSEESSLPPYSTRQQWQRYWLIDPLDGTKEFINRNGEFTVNVALVENGQPTLGVVHVPAQGITYTGARGLGAYKLKAGRAQAIAIRTIEKASSHAVSVVASRRHGGEALQQALAKLGNHFSDIETLSMGSSLKFCLVAEGKADIYPRLAPTSEWDTAAAQAVVEAAGGAVVDNHFQALRYNQKDDILNPHFYVWGDQTIDWPTILRE